MSAPVRARMQTPSCTSCQLGSLTTTRFTRTRRSDIVHPVSSSQLTETRDRVRSFGGYNTRPLAAVEVGLRVNLEEKVPCRRERLSFLSPPAKQKHGGHS